MVEVEVIKPNITEEEKVLILKEISEMLTCTDDNFEYQIKKKG